MKNNDEINAGGDGSYAGRGKEEKKFFNKKYEKELKETGKDVNSNFFQMEHVVPVSTALKGTGIKRKSKEGYQKVFRLIWKLKKCMKHMQVQEII